MRLDDKVVLCRVLGKYIMYADLDDLAITPHLCLNGYWESWITVAMARLLQPEWRCIDVGANHGYYSVIMADAVGEEGHVLVVEPNPHLIELLKLTLDVNGLQRQATVLQRAAYDSDSDTVCLVIPKGRGSTATLFRAPTASDEPADVESVTLDTLTKEWPCVDLVKIDAEGAEEAIWRGMLRTLERNPGITVIMEVNCCRYAHPEEFVRSIQDVGFPLRFIDYDSIVRDLTERQILTDRVDEDWMLFLRRG